MKLLFYSKQTLAVVLFCLGFMSNTLLAQTPNLLIKATSATIGDNSQARSMAVDASGNTYITGYFSGSVAFGSTTLVSAGGQDIFLAKYDNTGSFQWAKRAGGSVDNDIAYGVAVSGSDVYITGFFNSTANFNTPSATGSNEITSAGGTDIFLAKYDNTGSFQWAKRAGGTTGDIAYGVAVSGSDVYITGSFNSTANFNTPSATGSNEITSAGNSDIFLAKYDNTGSFQWAKRAGGTTGDIAYGVAVSGSDVYITGSFNSTANFNTPSATGSNEITSAGQDIFLAKYNSSGIFQWAKRAGGTSNDVAYGVVVSGSDVYITGYFQGTANFNTPSATGSNEITSAGSLDIFLAKYDNTGSFQWAKRAGAVGTSNDAAYGVAVSGSDVYITGGFRGTANFNTPSATGSNELTTVGTFGDVFLARYAGAVLPIELLSFSGKHTEGGNLLTWQTANEVNNKGFEVERAPQPPQGASPMWETIGFVDAKGKAATYEFTDKAPFGGWGLYRLRQIDYDGKETLSKVISIATKDKGKLTVYPNPVSNTLNLNYTEGGDFQILNLLGQQVMVGKNPPLGAGGLDVSALPQGTYVLKVGAEQVKFVKQ